MPICRANQTGVHSIDSTNRSGAVVLVTDDGLRHHAKQPFGGTEVNAIPRPIKGSEVEEVAFDGAICLLRLAPGLAKGKSRYAPSRSCQQEQASHLRTAPPPSPIFTHTPSHHRSIEGSSGILAWKARDDAGLQAIEVQPDLAILGDVAAVFRGRVNSAAIVNFTAADSDLEGCSLL